MDNSLFRKKSIERISSPEDLSDYLRVTSVSAFLVLLASTLVLIGLIVWSYFISINSYVYGEGVVADGVMTATFSDDETSGFVQSDMSVVVGDVSLPIDTIGRDEAGRVITVSRTDIPAGNYEVKVCYKQTQIIDMLLN